MVQGLKFLCKKGFHPKNKANQQRVWEAEQAAANQEQKMKERMDQLTRERDDEELAKARGDYKVGFLYAVPPGMEDEKKKSVEKKSSAPTELHQPHPGDDDAAAAFRAMLKRGVVENDTVTTEAGNTGRSPVVDPAAFESSVLQGSAADPERKRTNLSALEKAVGRKKEQTTSLTLEDQIERFPVLANAPRAQGMTATDVGVKFNPLGTQIRNVKCMVCGIWGHSRGDRECAKSGWDPFSSKSRKETAESRATSQDLPSRKDDATADSRSISSSSSSRDARRRRKKERRKKKDRKRRRRRDSDSDHNDDSSVDGDEKERRRRKKHKKHKRKREKN